MLLLHLRKCQLDIPTSRAIFRQLFDTLNDNLKTQSIVAAAAREFEVPKQRLHARWKEKTLSRRRRGPNQQLRKEQKTAKGAWFKLKWELKLIGNTCCILGQLKSAQAARETIRDCETIWTLEKHHQRPHQVWSSQTKIYGYLEWGRRSYSGKAKALDAGPGLSWVKFEMSVSSAGYLACWNPINQIRLAWCSIIITIPQEYQ